ncbi:MAG: DUF5605 domain-containing protein [Lachnoclostridium sp.]|nr:DUF5605 domain-containing protein [Lachnoclostridium sp.]
MKHELCKFLIIIFLFAAAVTAHAEKTPIYGRWEHRYIGPADDKAYYITPFTATFVSETDTVVVPGFYDGNGQYVLRFMPLKQGKWSYLTSSDFAKSLDGLSGSIDVSDKAQSHGPVRVDGRHSFLYADSSRFMPFGTTIYAWNHMTPELKSLTLESLRKGSFNKVRMCVMPKSYSLCKKQPQYFPFVEGESSERGMTVTARDGKKYDLTRFNPEFYANLEACVDSLAELGVQADLILFHPYDKGEWGFDSMPAEVNQAYARYVSSRLSSFHNVWWSMANEYDYVVSKTEDDWLDLIDQVDSCDPYRHLLSIHGSTATYFPYETVDRITHTSIQDEAPVMEQGRAAILRCIYRKPVVLDEVCYEGNLSNRWGRLSGQEMAHRIWCGVLGGTYVTHGECLQQYPSPNDTIMWAEGGRQRGESWKRIGFIRDIVESMPEPLQPADISRDIMTSTGGPGHYLVYFGTSTPESWMFNLPAKCADYEKLKEGTRFKVEIIDTWNMTITPWAEIMETDKANDYRLYDKSHRNIRLPMTPYILLRLTAI